MKTLIFTISILFMISSCGRSSNDRINSGQDGNESESGSFELIEASLYEIESDSFTLSGKCSTGQMTLTGYFNAIVPCEEGAWSFSPNVSGLALGLFQQSIEASTGQSKAIQILNRRNSESYLKVYPFEATPLTSSSGQVDAFSSQEVSIVTDSERGSVAEFSGTTPFVQLTNSSDNNFRNKDLNQSFDVRAISFFFKTGDINGTQVLFDEGGNTHALGLIIDQGKLKYGVKNNGIANLEVLEIDLTGRESLWNFVYAEFDQGEMKLILNETEVTKAASFTSIPDHGDEAGIGSVLGSGSAFEVSLPSSFFGQIDQFIITNKTLSESEIEIAKGELPAATTLSEEHKIVAHYQFEDIADLGKDKSSKNHHLNVSQILSTNDQDRGFVADFQANASGDFGSYDEFHDAFSERTVSFWMKNSTTQTATLFEEGGATNGLAITLSEDYLHASVRAGGQNTQLTLTTDYLEYLGKWTHVGVVFSQGKFRLYLNGELKIERTASYSEIPTHSNDGGIGNTISNSLSALQGGAFEGLLDDIKIYRRPLSDGEIKFLAR